MRVVAAIRDRRVLIAIAALAAVAVVILVVLLSGDDDRPSLESALAYIPVDAAAVFALDTDLDDEQYSSFGSTAGRGLLGGEFGVQDLPFTNFETAVSVALASQGINYDSDVKPVLGGNLVFAVQDPDGLRDTGENLAALQVGDVDAAERLLGDFDMAEAGSYKRARLYAPRHNSGPIEPGEPPAKPSEEDAEIAIDGDVLIAGDVDELTEAIDRAAGRGAAGGSGSLTIDDFDRGLEDLPEDALLRLHADPQAYLKLPELRGLRELPWMAATEAVGGSLSFTDEELIARLNVVTDPDGLSDEDLPLSPQTGEPELVRRDGEIASASLDQSQTTAFLLALARAVLADSRFVRDVEALERDLGISFEEEVLRQFAGPSASSATLRGEFAARSTVADPAAMRELLPRLAPRLPELVRDLDSLGRVGLLSLLFFAPDAPVATSASHAELAARIPPAAPDELLFEMRGPRGPARLVPVVPLPERIVFGMVDDVFVVASDVERAREIATAPADPEDGLTGASVLFAPELDDAGDAISRVIGFDPGPLDSAEGEAEIDTRSLRTRLKVRFSVEGPPQEEETEAVFPD